MEAARYLPGSTFLLFPVTTHMPSFMGTWLVFLPYGLTAGSQKARKH